MKVFFKFMILSKECWISCHRAMRRAVNKLYPYFLRNCYENVNLGKDLKVNGLPMIDVRRGAKLVLGDNVSLNSCNRGYHLNMYSNVKLLADRAAAEIQIGSHTRIHGSCIHAYKSIEIGERCLIAANCQIMDGSGHDSSFKNVSDRINTQGVSKPVVIEDDVWLATGVVVLPGVRIGKGSIVSANSVVVKDIPPMVVAGGNPAKVIMSVENSK